MKKILINLLAVGAITATITACSSGGTPNSSSNPPSVSSTEISTPPGATEAAGSPLYFDASTNTVYLPINGSYGEFSNVPQDIIDALSAPGTQIEASGSGYLVIPNHDGSSDTPIYALIPNTNSTQANSNGLITLGAIIPASLALTSNVIVPNSTDIVYAADNKVFVYQNNQLVESENVVNYCPGATGDVTAINTYTYNGELYFGFGTSTGSICAGEYDQDNTTTFTNLSSQAPSNRYEPSSVSSVQVASAGNYLYGYWQMNGTTAPLYQVISQQQTNANPIAQAFWQLNTSNPQTSSSGTTVTFSNTPSSVNSVYVDNNNNTYVGTTDGSVYKLATGFTTWTSTVLETGSPINLSPTNTGSGAVATSNDGKVFEIN